MGKRLLSALVQFGDLCLAGGVPLAVYFGASLCSLSKKNGGIRPVAVGSTMRHVVAKTACRSARDAAIKKLASIINLDLLL